MSEVGFTRKGEANEALLREMYAQAGVESMKAIASLHRTDSGKQGRRSCVEDRFFGECYPTIAFTRDRKLWFVTVIEFPGRLRYKTSKGEWTQFPERIKQSNGKYVPHPYRNNGTTAKDYIPNLPEEGIVVLDNEELRAELVRANEPYLDEVMRSAWGGFLYPYVRPGKDRVQKQVAYKPDLHSGEPAQIDEWNDLSRTRHDNLMEEANHE